MRCSFRLLSVLCSLPAFLALVESGATPAVKAPAPKPDHENIAYARHGERALTLDVFLPASRASGNPPPVVVCLHGGAWEKGSKINMRPFARELAARGFAAAAVEYRLSGEAPFPAAIVDARAAVRWLRQHGSTLGVNPALIFATGHSAGGHLAALLATSAQIDFGDRADHPTAPVVQGAAALAAHTDFLIPHIGAASERVEQAFWKRFLGGTQAEARDTYRLASPHAHVSATAAPLLVVAGEKDHESTHAREIRSSYARLGRPVRFAIITDAPHNFMGQALWRAEAADLTADFFRSASAGK